MEKNMEEISEVLNANKVELSVPDAYPEGLAAQEEITQEVID